MQCLKISTSFMVFTILLTDFDEAVKVRRKRQLLNLAGTGPLTLDQTVLQSVISSIASQMIRSFPKPAQGLDFRELISDRVMDDLVKELSGSLLREVASSNIFKGLPLPTSRQSPPALLPPPPANNLLPFGQPPQILAAERSHNPVGLFNPDNLLSPSNFLGTISRALGDAMSGSGGNFRGRSIGVGNGSPTVGPRIRYQTPSRQDIELTDKLQQLGELETQVRDALRAGRTVTIEQYEFMTKLRDEIEALKIAVS